MSCACQGLIATRCSPNQTSGAGPTWANGIRLGCGSMQKRCTHADTASRPATASQEEVSASNASATPKTRSTGRTSAHTIPAGIRHFRPVRLHKGSERAGISRCAAGKARVRSIRVASAGAVPNLTAIGHPASGTLSECNKRSRSRWARRGLCLPLIGSCLLLSSPGQTLGQPTAERKRPTVYRPCIARSKPHHSLAPDALRWCRAGAGAENEKVQCGIEK